MRPPGPRTQWVFTFLPTVIVILLIFGLNWAFGIRWTRGEEPQPIPVGDDVMVQARVLAQTEDLIQNHYYLEPEGTDALFHRAMYELVDGLGDRYSFYLDPDAYRDAMKNMTGRFPGLGISIAPDIVPIRVLTPLRDSPAYRAGVKPGDQIVRLDGNDVTSLPYDTIMERLSGPEGSHVSLQLLRERPDGEPERVDLSFNRASISSPSMTNAMMLGGDLPSDRAFSRHRLGNASVARAQHIGYVRIESFKSHTAEEFQEAMATLLEAGMERLVLDLRGNSGGVMDACVEMAGAFLPAGSLVVYTAGRNPEYNQQEVTTEDARYPDLPLVVLVDGGSASASEILAGCLQDYHRALLIGTNTFGKGLVQKPFLLADNASALRLTIARYFTPSGRCLQQDETTGFRGGIAPDIPLPISNQEALILGHLHRDQIVIGGQPWHTPEVTALLAEPFTDRQLEAAVDVLAGRPVAGRLAPGAP